MKSSVGGKREKVSFISDVSSAPSSVPKAHQIYIHFYIYSLHYISRNIYIKEEDEEKAETKERRPIKAATSIHSAHMERL